MKSENGNSNDNKMLSCSGGVMITEWKDIPVEILLEILSLIDDHRVVIVASGVCCGWRDAISWGLTHLNLSWCMKNMNSLVLSIIPKFAKLRVVNLQQATPQLHDNAIEKVSPCLGRGLEDLDLSKSSKLTDASLYALAHGCPNLSRLNIKGCKAISHDAIAYLARHCRLLTFLNLDECIQIATDTALKAIALYCNQMESLSLRWCEKVSDEGVNSLARGCPNLSTIDLSGCLDITHESIISVANNCTNLRWLGLNYCLNITDRAMYGLAESQLAKNVLAARAALKNGYMEGLVYLDIGLCTALNPSAVQAVCDSFPALHTCPGRRSLIITGCLRLSDAHCACVFQMSQSSL